MNIEKSIMIQSLLDGELGAKRRTEVLALLDEDPEAQSLYDDLVACQDLLKIGEPPRELPESREFYWSKISRGITQIEGASESKARQPGVPSSFADVLRLLLPASVVALVMMVSLMLDFDGGETTGRVAAAFHEVESLREDTSFFTFRSETEGITLVWINNY